MVRSATPRLTYDSAHFYYYCLKRWCRWGLQGHPTHQQQPGDAITLKGHWGLAAGQPNHPTLQLVSGGISEALGLRAGSPGFTLHWFADSRHACVST
jgi:hypothetical protein